MTHVDHADLLANARADLADARQVAPRAHDALWSPLRAVGYDGVPVSGSRAYRAPERYDTHAATWWRRAVESLDDLHDHLGYVAAQHGVPHSTVVLGRSRGEAPLPSVLSSIAVAVRTMGRLEQLGDLGDDDAVVMVGDACHDVLARMRRSAGPRGVRRCITCRKVMPDEREWPHPRCARHVCKVCHANDRDHGRVCWRCNKQQSRHGTTEPVRCGECPQADVA